MIKNFLELINEKKKIVKLTMTALVGLMVMYGGISYSASAMMSEKGVKSTCGRCIVFHRPFFYEF